MRWCKGGVDFRSSYSLKQYLQSVLLGLVLFVEIRDGRFYFKRDALQNQLLQSSDSAHDMVARISQVRQRATFRTIWPLWVRSGVARVFIPRLLHILHARFDRSISKEIRGILGENFHEEAASLLLLINSQLPQIKTAL